MKKLLIVLLLAGAVYACTQIGDTSSPPVSVANSFCYSGGNDPCPQLPYEVNENFGIGYNSFLDSVHQPPFDVFSWQTFIALNWPADSTGKPMGNSIADYPDAPRVWDFYKDPAEVFGHSSAEMVLHLKATPKHERKFFYMTSKAPHPLTKMSKLRGFQEADGHPLIDRNLNFALYEIKMNGVEANFVEVNQLTTVANIYNYVKKHHDSAKGKDSFALSLPVSDSAKSNNGMIEIKASWRILDTKKGDDTSRYYCRKATIYIDSLHSVSGKSFTVKATVGLVGMHIIRKTGKTFEKLIWSTFEHVDNVPDNLQDAQMDISKRWSFYNPKCLDCPQNIPPRFLEGDSPYYRWDSVYPYAARYRVSAPGQLNLDSLGTQATRIYPVYTYTEQINKLWQAKLKGTVWANYRLIGTQWQAGEAEFPPNAPFYLANSTLETYIQQDASCITCHGDFAGVNYVVSPGDTAYISTDLSFLFPVYAR